MENKRILFERYLRGEVSSEELQRLLSFFEEENGAGAELDDKLEQLLDQQSSEVLEPTYLSPMLERNKTKLTTAILKSRQSSKKIHSIRKWRWKVSVVAAVLICVFGVVMYLQWDGSKQDEVEKRMVDIAPGADRALLILDGVKEFVLDGKATGIVNDEGAVRYADGTLLTSLDKLERLILRTPKGGQFKATLPDGTLVWLNADSEISYPAVFGANERRLSIRGEVYLQVAKDKKRPFVVESEYQKIEVLGTHFNVNAYRDKGDVITTLSEGSVRVTQSRTGETLVLKPGEQAQVALQGKMKVRPVDIEEVLSWKEGLYIINNQELGLFAKQLERWYNVEVDMSTSSATKLSAVIPRNATLITVLDAISLKTDVQFHIEGRRVTAIKR